MVAGALVSGAARGSLPRGVPEAHGVSSAALLELVHALEDRVGGLHSLMIARDGHVILEGWWAPYRAGDNHVLYSLSKSFTATAVGLAAAEGRLSIDDEVLKFFPAEAPAEPGPNLRAMRVRDLLMMTTGHQDEPPLSPDRMSVRSFLAHPVPHLPGTHFRYNTPATFMQSAIVRKATGQTVLEYLRTRLFEPLGIERPVWETNFEGIPLGGYGLRVRTEDILKFGLLHLRAGEWGGRRLLPAEWVRLATSRQTSNGSHPESDWNQGYGFQFWRCRHNAYRGDGAFGQFCLVMPDQGVVVAITGGLGDMQGVLNLLWERLLPACEPRRLRANNDAHERLRAKLARLEVVPAQGAPFSVAAERWVDRRYDFPENPRRVESLWLRPGLEDREWILSLVVNGRTLHLPCGFREWRRGRAPFPAGPLAQFPDEPVAGTYGWETDHQLTVKVCATETPFHLTLRMAFDGDAVTLDAAANVAFGPTAWETVTGRAEPVEAEAEGEPEADGDLEFEPDVEAETDAESETGADDAPSDP